MPRGVSRASKFVVPPELRRHLNPRKRPRTESPKSEATLSTRIKASSPNSSVSNAGSGTDTESPRWDLPGTVFPYFDVEHTLWAT